MSDVAGLLERVKAATGPDRYADCHLWVLAQGGDARMVVCDSSEQDFVWERGIGGFCVRDVVKFRAVPKYTASVDVALALTERLLPGRMGGFEPGLGGACHGKVIAVSKQMAQLVSRATATTAPLAILAATLSVIAAQEPTP
jgi:hypothetical protein